MKVKILLYCILFLLIISCSKHTVQPPAELANGRVTGTVHGLVYDFCENSTFDSGAVEITWVDEGIMKSTVTLDKGYYIITDLPPGDYTIHFAASDDYAVGTIEVHVPTLEEILYSTGSFGAPPPTDRDYEHTVSEEIYLYQKNAGLKGHVYKEISGQTTEPAEGVEVVANYTYKYVPPDSYTEGYDIYPGKYTEVTDAEGFFSFDSLPGTPDVIIETLPFDDNDNDYEFTYKTEYLIQKSTRTVEDIILETAEPYPFIIQNNFVDQRNFPITDNLMVTFSKTMNLQSMGYSLLYDGFQSVDCDTSWSNSMILTIDPYYNLLTDKNYTLHLWGKSSDNREFDEELEFRTQAGIKLISTNLESDQYYNGFPVDEDITLTFSLKVNINHPNLELYVTDSTDSYVYFDPPSLSTNSKTVTLSHPNPLEPEQDYMLRYEIYSTIPGDSTSGVIEFSTQSNDLLPSQVSGFRIISPNENNIDWNTGSSGNPMTLRWETLESAEWYIIFAEDNYKNSNRIAIDSVGARDYMTRQTTNITLPSTFDYYQHDGGIQTPFLNNTEVTLYIAAVNHAGMGQLRSRTISDNLSPDLELNYDHGGPIDNTGNPTSAYIYLEFLSTTGEYLNTSTLNVTTSDNNLTYDETYEIWYPDDNHNTKNGGMIRIIIAADYDATGETITIRCEDTSENEGSDEETL